jgi:RNA polymerase sigma-70 factor (ECF subfamily)
VPGETFAQLLGFREAPVSDAAPLPREPRPLESTARLLALVRQGDARARERLAGRYLAVLRRFAHGRLPPHARGLMDTDDLVQVTVVRALQHIETFEPRREGAFLAYLRQILLNQLRDEVRRVSRRPGRSELADNLADPGISPLERVIGSEAMDRYENALGRLTEEQRESVVLRLELGYSYSEIAEALDRPTDNAARMLVTRALVRLAEEMKHAGEDA